MVIKTIIITHFVNPHKFWFFDANTPIALLREIADLEKQLPQHAIPLRTMPLLAELVIVDFEPWHKHIRGIIINPNTMVDQTVLACHVWAIDYGFPIFATLDQLSPMPVEFAKAFDFICCGGVKDVYPIAHSEKWSTDACKCIEGLICEAADVSFVVRYKDANDRCWGDMAIHFAQYKDIFVQNHLISMLQAEHAGVNFQKHCTDMESVKGPIWLGNDFSDKSQISKESNNNGMLQNISNWWAKAATLMATIEPVKPIATPPRKRLIIERYKEAMRKRQEEKERAEMEAAVALIHSIKQTQKNESLAESTSIDTPLATICSHKTESDSNSNELNRKLEIRQQELSPIAYEIAASAYMAQSSIRKKLSISERFNQQTKLYEEGISGKREKSTQTETARIESSNYRTANGQHEANPKSQSHPLTSGKLVDAISQQPNQHISPPMNQQARPGKFGSPPQIKAKEFPTAVPAALPAHQSPPDHPRISSALGRKGRRYLSDPADIPDKLDRILLSAHYERFVLGNEEVYSLTHTGVKSPNVKPTRNALGRSELLAKPCKISPTSPDCIPESLEYPLRFPNVLLHSEKNLRPVTKMVEAGFSEIQQVGLKKRGIQKVYNSQAYSWPCIKNGASTVVIGAKASGKTWGYLPALIELVHAEMKKPTCYKLCGPIAVILVPTARHIREMKTLCHLLLDETYEQTIVGAFPERNIPEVDVCLLLCCSFLITTPANFMGLLELDDKRPPREKLFDLYRLHYIAVDKLHLMQLPDVEAVVAKISEPALHLRQKSNVQYMLTSREWNSALPSILSNCQSLSFIFSDYLEAACYGRTKIFLRMVSNGEKLTHLMRFLASQNADNRTIIFCQDDEEVNLVHSELRKNNYACCTANHAKDVAQANATLEADKFIFVCTDLSFLQISDNEFDNIVHYSMTNNWIGFTRRFSAIAGKHPDITKRNVNEDLTTHKTNACILIDERNNLQLPALMENLRRFDVKFKKTEWERMIAVCQQLDSERRFLCEQLLQYGKCSDALCARRHKVLQHEKTFEIDDLPLQGELRVKVLKVHTPTHFSIALKAHKRPGSKNFEEIKSYEDIKTLLSGLKSHYLKPENRLPYWPIKEGDVCVYKKDDALPSYQRARIINVVQLTKRTIITMKLLDTGAVVMNVDPNSLYECDIRFKDLPAQAIDVRLLGVVPVESEHAWDPMAESAICRVLLDEKTEHVQVNSIHFRIANTLFVRDITLMVRANIGHDSIPLTSVANLLIRNKYGKYLNTQKDDVANALDVECI